jgi:hypothetical protein
MKILIERLNYGDKQTIGKLYLLNSLNEIIEEFWSLELPWKDNQRRISCIPEGVYKARKHNSPKHGLSLWIQDVPNRSEILIHKGNYYTDILGCILIGSDLMDINKDGLLDVTNSKNSIKKLMSMLEDIDGIMVKIEKI